ncbi:MAG TPA: hypothetical protein VL068_02275 [Microthrixaceae bacterium]|nr:hypothetical protein [Microthrixaceae bacterium]
MSSSGSARDTRLELAGSARDRLLTGLDQTLGERFTRTGKVDMFADGIVISGFTLFDRPDDGQPEREPFSESSFTARRRIGLMVIRRLIAEGPSNVSAANIPEVVGMVMADPNDWPIRLRDWVEGLEPAGKAAVAAATATWCEGAIRLVGTGRSVKWSDPLFATSWDVPGRMVQLRVNLDARLGTPAAGERLLLINDSTPGPKDRLRAGFVALVIALGSRMAPDRVTIGAPSRGLMERYPVTSELLDLTVDQVIESVVLAAGSRSSKESR